MRSLVRCWCSFLRLRKQNDCVKVMLIFLLVGLGFLFYSFYSGIQVYTMMKAPVEYVICGDGNIKDIEKLENGAAVSAQKTSSLLLSGPWGEITMQCLELSESYLEQAYAVSEKGAMKVIYLNQAAFEQISRMQDRKGQSLKISDAAGEELIVSYWLDEDESGKAKIKIWNDRTVDETPCAFCAANSARLSENDGTLRVWMPEQDLDGSNLRHLADMGFNIVNSCDVEKNALTLEMQLMQIKFGFLTSALCLLSVMALKKYGEIGRAHV